MLEASESHSQNANGNYNFVNDSNLLQGEESLKNIRKRKDGLWEYRKMLNDKRVSIYARTQKELLSEVKRLIQKPQPILLQKQERTFFALALEWYNLFKKDIKSASNYRIYINNDFSSTPFNQDINKITLIELQSFLNKIKLNRKTDYCFNIIKNVYKYALQKEVIKKNISEFLVKPKLSKEKGKSFTLREQKLILENLEKTPIKNEILLFLLTGCRRTEACTIKLSDINFEKNVVFINGTKTKSAKRYVNISEDFKKLLYNNFDNMFKKNLDYYTKEFQFYLNSLNIHNHKLHDLRHTFSTNLYYLGVPDKQRQYLMGHSSIVMTNDIYTTLDPTITKDDILKLYNNLYPNF